MNSGKVFCIGFQKTGTTTMERVLSELGYRVTGPNHVRTKDIAQRLEQIADQLSQQHDAFQDNPWPLVYRQMDARHPGSKFILTVRDEQKWSNSFRNHFEGLEHDPMQELLYGPPGQPAEAYKARVRRHNDEVRDYFRDRRDDLLVIDISQDPRWEPVCAFLGKPVPARSFPHSNHRKLAFLPPRLREWLKWHWRGLRRHAKLVGG